MTPTGRMTPGLQEGRSRRVGMAAVFYAGMYAVSRLRRRLTLAGSDLEGDFGQGADEGREIHQHKVSTPATAKPRNEPNADRVNLNPPKVCSRWGA